MERQLVKQGRSAITMTLPAQWIKKNNLSEKDSVQVFENEDTLIVSTSFNKKEKTKCELNLKDAFRSFGYHMIMGKYIEGYDTIVVHHNNPKLIQEISKVLIGFIIEEHGETKSVLRNLIVVPEENFEEIFRRTTQLFLKQVRTLRKVIENKDNYELVKSEERLLDDNILYCLRYLKKYEKSDNSYKQFLLCSTLESAGDQIVEIAKVLSKKDKELVEKIITIVEDYVSCIFTNDAKRAYKNLREFRNSLEKNTFICGLTYSLAENLYNFMGYIIGKD